MFSILIRRSLLAAFVVLFVLWSVSAAPSPDKQKPLQIYFVDVEGGQATLFVTPVGQSLLIDTGWAGFDGRDAGRILAAAKDEHRYADRLERLVVDLQTSVTAPLRGEGLRVLT